MGDSAGTPEMHGGKQVITVFPSEARAAGVAPKK
jgi:hypothetical protein